MDVFFMKKALELAKKAKKTDEVPVGAVIVKNNKIISYAFNKKEKRNNALYHAEIIAIKKASKKLKSWRLSDCSIYISLEPCSMCLSALIQSRISNIYYGASDYKSGACGGLFNLLNVEGFNHYPKVKKIECKECSDILKEYFKQKRNN